MLVYIDSDFKCHVSDDGTMRAFDVPFFDGKCQTFVEGYRYVPPGESWTRSDGYVFHIEMISPWKPMSELEAAQAAYEQARAELLVPAEAAYQEGVNSI